MTKKQDMAAMLDRFEANAAKEHDKRETKATTAEPSDERLQGVLAR